MMKRILLFLCFLVIFTSCNKKEEPQSCSSNTDMSKMILTDCQCNKYRIIQIGEQYWMRENLRCNKYDTESKKAGKEIGTFGVYQFDPFYVDVVSYIASSEGLTAKYKNIYERFGYHYNWPAAVGTDANSGVGAIESVQGICPNGWHIPSVNEFEKLIQYIEVDRSYGVGKCGKALKYTEGWMGSGSNPVLFDAMPSGHSNVSGGTMQTGGFSGWAYYWTTSYLPRIHEDEANCYYICGEGDALYKYKYPTSYGLSVRCIKN